MLTLTTSENYQSLFGGKQVWCFQQKQKNALNEEP